MRIGIFGGSFNPPHLKHKEIVVRSLEENYLDMVIVVPTFDNYNKKDLVSFKDRCNMLNIMFKSVNNVFVSDISKDDKLQYTIDILNYYKNIYKDSDIYFMCGVDNVLELNTWKDYQDIINNYKLLVFSRENYNLSGLDKNILDRITFLDLGKNYISSTNVRKKLKLKNNVDELDENVLKYIKKNNLYN